MTDAAIELRALADAAVAGRVWTDADCRRAIQLAHAIRHADTVERYLAGEQPKRIAGSRNTVYRALRRAGIEPQRRRTWWAEAAELAAKGMGKNEIALWLGKHPSSIRYALKHHHRKDSDR